MRNIYRMIYFSNLKKSILKSSNIKKNVRQLLEDGLIQLHSKLDNNELDLLSKKLKLTYQEYERNSLSGRIKIENGALIEKRDAKYKNGEYYDSGYWHIFNIDKFNILNLKNLILESKDILSEITLKDMHYKVDAYISKDSFDPRTFHMDALYAYQYKTFVNLTNVSLSDGPFQYLLKSHLFCIKKFRYLLKNFFLRKDIKEISDDKDRGDLKYECVSFLGERGNAVLTDQHGWHGAKKQEENGFRIILVIYWSDINISH